MYEYEIIYKATGEHDILFARSRKNLAERYPNIDPASYDIVYCGYMD